MIDYRTTIRVQYFETDKMGVVHHSNYVRYYEIARTEMMVELGFSYGELEKQGVGMPVIAVHSRYFAPAFYEDVLTLRVFLKELPTSRITFYCEIYNESGQLLNEGSVELAFVNTETNRPCRPPKKLCELLSAN